MNGNDSSSSDDDLFGSMQKKNSEKIMRNAQQNDAPLPQKLKSLENKNLEKSDPPQPKPRIENSVRFPIGKTNENEIIILSESDKEPADQASPTISISNQNSASNVVELISCILSVTVPGQKYEHITWEMDQNFEQLFENVAKLLNCSLTSVRLTKNEHMLRTHETPRALGFTAYEKLEAHECQEETSVGRSDGAFNNDPDTLIVLVQSATSRGRKMEFQINLHESFAFIRQRYAELNNLDAEKVHFRYDNARVTDAQTAAELEIENEDQLDLYVDLT